MNKEIKRVIDIYGAKNLSKLFGVSERFIYYIAEGKRKSKRIEETLEKLYPVIKHKKARKYLKDKKARDLEFKKILSEVEQCRAKKFLNLTKDKTLKKLLNNYLIKNCQKLEQDLENTIFDLLDGGFVGNISIEFITFGKGARCKETVKEVKEYLESFNTYLRCYIYLDDDTGLICFELIS